MLNVVVPMAGAGSRFMDAGYDLPKPFIDIAGRMMIERVLDGLVLENAHYTLIIQKSFTENNGAILKNLADNSRVAFLIVEKLTEGACCTALAAHELINNSIPVIFADSDNIFRNSVFRAFTENALQGGLDGSLLTFRAHETMFSYVETNEQGHIVRVKEKEKISDRAVAGVYMFRRGADFIRCAVNMLIYGDRSGGEFYMSNACNWAVKLGLKMGVFDIGTEDWACVGTPEQLKNYMNLLEERW
jgi:dTDP-glucose pyrophosphorylase